MWTFGTFRLAHGVLSSENATPTLSEDIESSFSDAKFVNQVVELSDEQIKGLYTVSIVSDPVANGGYPRVRLSAWQGSHRASRSPRPYAKERCRVSRGFQTEMTHPEFIVVNPVSQMGRLAASDLVVQHRRNPVWLPQVRQWRQILMTGARSLWHTDQHVQSTLQPGVCFLHCVFQAKQSGESVMTETDSLRAVLSELAQVQARRGLCRMCCIGCLPPEHRKEFHPQSSERLS